MRNPERIPIIMTKLQKVWELHPDMRLGQLIIGIPKISGFIPPVDTFEMEDGLLECFMDLINGEE